MGNFVCHGAMLQCTFGTTPSTLTVTVPMRPKCGNPTVASATSAAMGVLTPMPCAPAITAPWAPPGKTMVMGQPALINNAKCMCMWGGMISVNNPSGSMSTQGG